MDRDVRPESGDGPRLRVLAQVSHAFAEVVTDYAQLVETIVRTAAELVGDGCQVFLLTEDQMLVNAGNAHRDPAIERDVRAFLAGPPQALASSQMVSAAVVRTGQPKLLAEIDPDAAVAGTDDAVKSLVARVRIFSAVIVPIRARRIAIGALSLIRTRAGHSYTTHDLALLQDVADRAGLAIENARLYGDLERRVRQRTAELEEANRELDTFSYSVAHDLRAPLRSIDGFSAALLEDRAEMLDEEGSRHLRHIRDSAQHMARLIDDLLALSRASRSEIRRETVDLSAIGRGILTRLACTAPERSIEVVVSDGIEVEGDATLLRGVLENLLGNAWKFTSKRAHARIELGVLREHEPAVVFVRDDGVGFDMSDAERLFGAFQRMHDGHEFEGTGIGLATVQRIVRRHGGRIWAESEVGRGTTMYFTLRSS